MRSEKGGETAKLILNRCSAGRTRQIARIVTARFDQALSPYGITANQLTMLCVIAEMEPVQVGEMQPYLQMEQSTLSRNVERMVKNGWVNSLPGSEDARIRMLALTDHGWKLMQNASVGWREAQAWADRKFGRSGIGGLRDIAKQLNPLLP